jgi:hypothetical protein
MSRNGAHQCLASLPASAFAKRMAARVVPLVTLAGVLHNKLVITHPRPLHADEEAALRRDGFEVGPSSRRRTSSPTELPVVHLVGAVPLDAWTTSLGLQPDELVRLAAEMDPPELLYGWARAAARQQRGDWAAALVTTAVVGDDLDGPLLVALLAPSELERRVVALLRAEGPGQRVVALLDHLDAPWPAELSSIVVDVLAGVLEWRIAVTGNGPVGQLLQLAALRLDPALADEAVDRLSGALAAAEAELLATGADGDGHGGAGARSSAAGSPASSAVHVQSPAAGSTGGAATFGIGRRNALTAGIAFWRPRLATMFSLLAFRKSLYHEMSALNMHLQQDGTTGHTA